MKRESSKDGNHPSIAQNKLGEWQAISMKLGSLKILSIYITRCFDCKIEDDVITVFTNFSGKVKAND